MWLSADDAINDSGAELSVVCWVIVTQLRSRRIPIDGHHLVQSVQLESATGSAAVCESLIILRELTLVLHGGTRTEFRRVKTLVSSSVSELLLGRTILDAIGYSLGAFLEKNHAKLGVWICPMTTALTIMFLVSLQRHLISAVCSVSLP